MFTFCFLFYCFHFSTFLLGTESVIHHLALVSFSSWISRHLALTLNSISSRLSNSWNRQSSTLRLGRTCKHRQRTYAYTLFTYTLRKLKIQKCCFQDVPIHFSNVHLNMHTTSHSTWIYKRIENTFEQSMCTRIRSLGLRRTPKKIIITSRMKSFLFLRWIDRRNSTIHAAQNIVRNIHGTWTLRGRCEIIVPEVFHKQVKLLALCVHDDIIGAPFRSMNELFGSSRKQCTKLEAYYMTYMSARAKKLRICRIAE